MENQTLKSVINWVEKNSQFIFIYRTDIDLSRRVNVDVRNKTCLLYTSIRKMGVCPIADLFVHVKVFFISGC